MYGKENENLSSYKVAMDLINLIIQNIKIIKWIFLLERSLLPLDAPQLDAPSPDHHH